MAPRSPPGFTTQHHHMAPPDGKTRPHHHAASPHGFGCASPLWDRRMNSQTTSLRSIATWLGCTSPPGTTGRSSRLHHRTASPHCLAAQRQPMAPDGITYCITPLSQHHHTHPPSDMDFFSKSWTCVHVSPQTAVPLLPVAKRCRRDRGQALKLSVLPVPESPAFSFIFMSQVFTNLLKSTHPVGGQNASRSPVDDYEALPLLLLK